MTLSLIKLSSKFPTPDQQKYLNPLNKFLPNLVKIRKQKLYENKIKLKCPNHLNKAVLLNNR